ncbi:MAG: trypsin-like peptidase domain-containing protein, partial [Terriglobia bacterium]
AWTTLAVGEKVYAIGAPEGLELTISEGLISGLRDFDKERVIQTSAAISPGSSGGGLFDAEGRLVGITTFYLKGGQSLNFALPAEWTLALDRQPPSASPEIVQSSPAFQALVWFEVGYKADQAREYDAAADAFGKAVQLKPDLEEAWYNLGRDRYALGKYGKAIGAEQEAVRLKSDDEAAWVYLGSAYDFLRQYDKAMNAEQEAIRLKPDDAGAWANLGSVYDDLWQDDKAMDAEQQAIRLEPEDATAWLVLGFAYSHLGQQSEVIKVYEKLKALDPKMADEFFKEAVLP